MMLSMFSEISAGTSFLSRTDKPVSRNCPRTASSESGMIVCAVHTNWKMGFSIDSPGSAPTITAPAPSPNRARPTIESICVSVGPRKQITDVISEQTTKTRDRWLFSAISLARRRTVPPAWQPC
uniref:Uncharacterized protein n=1 Tax=Opuntia streptacantha TaxID=393608 RepID=A0A7C8ZBV4_OPUST